MTDCWQKTSKPLACRKTNSIQSLSSKRACRGHMERDGGWRGPFFLGLLFSLLLPPFGAFTKWKLLPSAFSRERFAWLKNLTLQPYTTNTNISFSFFNHKAINTAHSIWCLNKNVKWLEMHHVKTSFFSWLAAFFPHTNTTSRKLTMPVIPVTTSGG